MGATTTNKPGATTDDDTTIRSPCDDHGMCVPTVHAMNVSLHLTDTPVGYDPPIGPPVYVRLSYNQREAGQPGAIPFFNVGPKWTFNMLSYIEDNPQTVGSVTRYGGGGGYVSYAYNPGTGTYAIEKQGGEVLTRSPAIGTASSYTLTSVDGSKRIYSTSNGATSGTRRVFLTSVVDAQGNALTFALTLGYDSSVRLNTITDAAGRQTSFSYTQTGKPLLVKTITDPFGRTATLEYDGSSRLSSITDVVGIKSEFSYDSNGLINQLKTPYCKPPYSGRAECWTFDYGPPGTLTTPPMVTTASGRWLTITDPLGYTERVEYVHQAQGVVPIAGSDTDVPTGVNAVNSNLAYRNTFYWDKASYPYYGDDVPAGSKNYSNAKLWHWLHTDHNYGQTSPILESVKEPLENRVWYAYEGQSHSQVEGTSARVTARARVLDDGTTQISKTTYNPQGSVLTHTDEAGRVTKYTYAPNGIDISLVQRQVSAVNQPLAYATLVSYPSYNAQHQPLSTIDASLNTWGYTYNAAGQMTTRTDPLNHVQTFNYDSAGRPTTVLNEDNVVVQTLTYPTSCANKNCDLPESITDVNGVTRTFERDKLDRVKKVTFPDGTYEETIYQNLDRSSSKDRLSRVTSYQYDAMRRLIAETDPENHTVQYEYHSNGLLYRLQGPNGTFTRWERDAQGRVTSRVREGGIVGYTYQPKSGRLLTESDSENQTKTFTWSTGDELRYITYTNTVNPTTTAYFEWDPYYPRLTQMIDGTGITSLFYHPVGYDGALQLGGEGHDDGEDSSAVVQSSPWMSTEYDALGRLSERSVTWDEASESWQYDNVGRVSHYTSPLGTFEYGYLGQSDLTTSRTLAETGTSIATSIATTWTYDSAQNERRLLSVTNSHGAQNLGLGYQRFGSQTGTNVYGQVASMLQTGGTGPAQLFCNTYDAADELSNVAKPVTGTTSCNQSLTTLYDFNQDAAGNLTSFSGKSGVGVAGTYNSANQLTSLGGHTFSYDSAGRPTSDGVRQFKWDAENRLIEVGQGTTVLARYRYDGLGRLFEAVHPGRGTDRFVWCGAELCARYNNGIYPVEDALQTRYLDEGEYHPSGVKTMSYPSGMLGVDTLVPVGKKLVATRNHIGNVTGFIDADRRSYLGDVSYTPYGEVVAGTQIAEKPYGGLYYDRLIGLYLSRTRVYDPSIGRWLTRDTIGEIGGLNLYAYVNDDPINRRDPLGLGDFGGGGASSSWDPDGTDSSGKLPRPPDVSALIAGLIDALSPPAATLSFSTPTATLLSHDEIKKLRPTGDQRDLLDTLFKTGADNPALSRTTLENYVTLARNALADPKKSTPGAIAKQTSRLTVIEEILKSRGGL